MDVFIIVSVEQERPIAVKVTQNITRIGRSSQCDVPIEKAALSRLHARILREGEQYYVEDCGSQNGTFIGGLRLSSKTLLPLHQPVDLANEVMISLSDTLPRHAEENSTQTLFTDEKTCFFIDILQQTGIEIKRYHPTRREVTIGRGTDNDLSLVDPFISRHHLIIKEENGCCTVALQDGRSHARLCVNNKICSEHKLQDGDTIEIGRTRMVFHTLCNTQEQPTIIGRYRVLEQLGQGAMGVVYLGEDQFIKRKSAIKVMLQKAIEGVDNDDHINNMNRLFREAKILSQLDHPNIVRFYEADYYRDGIFVAMEYLQGNPLDQIMARDERLPLEKKISIALQVCDGLQEIHNQKLIHRDIKPANLFVTLSGTVKIMDFGLVQVPGSSLTKSNNKYLGSPSYMAPERFIDIDNDHRSDIFSLGVTLYQFFTGLLPFVANNIPSLIFKILHENPVQPSKISPLLDDAWDAVLLKGLERDPAKRYESCIDLKRDLKKILNKLKPTPDETIPLGKIKRHKIVFYYEQVGDQEEHHCHREIMVTIDGSFVGSLTAHGILNVLTIEGPHEVHLEAMERAHGGEATSKSNHQFSISLHSSVCYIGIEEKQGVLRHTVHETPPENLNVEATLLNR